MVLIFFWAMAVKFLSNNLNRNIYAFLHYIHDGQDVGEF